MNANYTDAGYISLAVALDLDAATAPEHVERRRISVDVDGRRRIGRTGRHDVERTVDAVRRCAEQHAERTGRPVEWSVNHSPAWDDPTTPPPGWSAWSGTADPHPMRHPFETV